MNRIIPFFCFCLVALNVRCSSDVSPDNESLSEPSQEERPVQTSTPQAIDEQQESVAPDPNLQDSDVQPPSKNKNLEQPEMLVLTPQQLAQATKMLAAFEGKPLNDLIQVYAVMQMAAATVSPEDQPIFDFVLAKLAVYIAELEQ